MLWKGYFGVIDPVTNQPRVAITFVCGRENVYKYSHR